MKRRQDIELVRVLSAFGIVWFHSCAYGREIAYGGLIVFLILTGFFSGETGAVTAQLRKRSFHLIVPWAFWFLVYGAIGAVKGESPVPLDGGVIRGILVGPTFHMWYMPFAFFCLVALDVFKSHAPPASIALVCGSLAVLILATTPLWRQPSIALGVPIAQYAHAFAGILLGTLLSFWDSMPRKSGILLLSLAFIAAVGRIPYSGVGVPYAIGIVVGLLLLRRTSIVTSRVDVTVLSQCTLGIYFVHVLVLRVVQKVSDIHGVLLPIAAFVVSALSVAIARRTFPKLASIWS